MVPRTDGLRCVRTRLDFAVRTILPYACPALRDCVLVRFLFVASTFCRFILPQPPTILWRYGRYYHHRALPVTSSAVCVLHLHPAGRNSVLLDNMVSVQVRPQRMLLSVRIVRRCDRFLCADMHVRSISPTPFYSAVLPELYAGLQRRAVLPVRFTTYTLALPVWFSSPAALTFGLPHTAPLPLTTTAFSADRTAPDSAPTTHTAHTYVQHRCGCTTIHAHFTGCLSLHTGFVTHVPLPFVTPPYGCHARRLRWALVDAHGFRLAFAGRLLTHLRAFAVPPPPP